MQDLPFLTLFSVYYPGLFLGILNSIITQLSEDIGEKTTTKNSALPLITYIKLQTVAGLPLFSLLSIQAVFSVVTKIFIQAPQKISAKETKDHSP